MKKIRGMVSVLALFILAYTSTVFTVGAATYGKECYLGRTSSEICSFAISVTDPISKWYIYNRTYHDIYVESDGDAKIQNMKVNNSISYQGSGGADEGPYYKSLFVVVDSGTKNMWTGTGIREMKTYPSLSYTVGAWDYNEDFDSTTVIMGGSHLDCYYGQCTKYYQAMDIYVN